MTTAAAKPMTYVRQIGFLIHYDSQRGTCIDIQFGRDLFEAVSRFRLDGRRRASSIQAIREIGARPS